MSYGTYYVDDYSGTDYQKITSAINAANSAGGGNVALSNRSYLIDQSIILHSRISFCGLGGSSSIVCSADVPIIQINRENDDSSHIEIFDMTLSYSSMNSTNSFHIEADRPIQLKIYKVTFNGAGRDYSGVLTWDASSGSRTQKINASSSYSAFMTHVESCLFNSGSVWLNDSDSRIINNYIWANSTSTNNLNYAIRLSNGAVNISGNDIVPGNHSGIYLASTCSGVRIENNYFDGSWESVHTGWGVYISGAVQCIILGNVFNNIYKGGIYATGAFLLNVCHNAFYNINRSAGASTCYDVRINGTSSQVSTGHLIEGNAHYRTIAGTKNYAVHIGSYAQATVVNNSLIDWNSSGAYVKPSFVVPDSKYSIRKDNRVTNNATGTYPYQFDEGSITVQHSSSAHSATVSFSSDFAAQNITPKLQDIHINFVGAASNSAIVFSVWDLTSTGFKISYRPINASSLSSGTFYWRVSLR